MSKPTKSKYERQEIGRMLKGQRKAVVAANDDRPAQVDIVRWGDIVKRSPGAMSFALRTQRLFNRPGEAHGPSPLSSDPEGLKIAAEILNVLGRVERSGDASCLRDLADAFEAIHREDVRQGAQPDVILLILCYGRDFFRKNAKQLVVPTLREAADRLAECDVHWDEPQVGRAMRELGLKYSRKPSGRPLVDMPDPFEG